MEFTCCKSSVSNDALITQEDTEKDIEKSDSKGDISWITRTRNWKLPLNFSSRQQIYLKQFVNEVTGSTPIEDQAKCLEIAQELELPVSRVTLYFSRFDSNFQQKKKVKLGKIKKSGKKLIEEPKSIKSIKDDFNVIPELNLKIKKPRFKFTPEVDNTLLIGHAICIKLLKNRSNFWAPIVKLFNGEASSSTCRTRHTVLKKKEVNNEFSRKIEAEFSDWFDLQVESGSAFLLDPELLDPELLDISGYVQRYIHQPEELKSIQVSGSVVCLPDSAKVFEDLYDISVTNPRVDVFQSLLNNVASKQKLSYLRSQSLTSGIKKEILDHSDVDAEDDLGIRLCESLMKVFSFNIDDAFYKGGSL